MRPASRSSPRTFSCHRRHLLAKRSAAALNGTGRPLGVSSHHGLTCSTSPLRLRPTDGRRFGPTGQSDRSSQSARQLPNPLLTPTHIESVGHGVPASVLQFQTQAPTLNVPESGAAGCCTQEDAPEQSSEELQRACSLRLSALNVRSPQPASTTRISPTISLTCANALEAEPPPHPASCRSYRTRSARTAALPACSLLSRTRWAESPRCRPRS